MLCKCGKLFSHNYKAYCCSELKVRIPLNSTFKCLWSKIRDLDSKFQLFFKITPVNFEQIQDMIQGENIQHFPDLMSETVKILGTPKTRTLYKRKFSHTLIFNFPFGSHSNWFFLFFLVPCILLINEWCHCRTLWNWLGQILYFID